jgi:S-layer family protein
MEDRQLPKGRIVTVLVIAIALLLVGSTMVLASHQFSDVPTGAYYHSAVDWGSDRGIIAGCTTHKFCPGDPLTRGQAMVIMQGLAKVVSPQVLTAELAQVAHKDIDSKPIECQTATWNRPWEEIAFGFARTSIEPEITQLAYTGRVVYQVNGGAWTVMPPTTATPSESNEFNEDVANVHFGTLNLAPNTTYKFGIQIEPFGGKSSGNSNPDGDYECALVMQIFNRNP